jgi:hypothetical protein
MTTLRILYLTDTQVTEVGVNDLKKSLPECDIYR